MLRVRGDQAADADGRTLTNERAYLSQQDGAACRQR
jgi:ABC-type cobalamin transport system ATPase subunit